MAQMITRQPNGANSFTQLQMTVCHFLTNKHSIAVLKGLIYNSQKAQTKKLKLFKGFRQNTN